METGETTQGPINAIPDHLKPEAIEPVVPEVPEIAPMPEGTQEMLAEVQAQRDAVQAGIEARGAAAAQHIEDTRPEITPVAVEEVPEQPLIQTPASVTESLAAAQAERDTEQATADARAAEVAQRIIDTMPPSNEQ